MNEVFPDPDGILPVDKPAGLVSHAVVSTLRRRFGFSKVGHGGTLDPDATGLLPILLGKGTKISDRVMGGDKTYTGTVRFGERTATQDRLGEVLERRPTDALTEAQILEAIRRDFVGDLFQKPPMYSAVKIDGQPLYRMAMRGEDCEREERFVHVYAFRVLAFRPDPVAAEADIEVCCTKGTYIRTLANDLGEAVGTGAHLRNLRRIASGCLDLSRAVRFADLLDMSRAEVAARVIPCAAYLDGRC